MKKSKFLLSVICLCLFLSTLMFFMNNVDATVEEDLHSQTKITSATNTVQAPTVTVLTHGFGANYTHWSNNGSSDDFAYNSNSIIAKMFIELENNMTVYIADSNSTINTDGTLTLAFDLKKITYNDYVNNIAPKTTAMLDDVSKHILLIFDSGISTHGHDEVYEEFHYVLDNVSLQYKSLTGVLPKYNLIGHSRGGITNIMYATEHLYNVHEIFSIGTPYNGSALGGIEPIISMLGYSIFDSTTNSYIPNTTLYPGITDVLSSEVNKDIRDAWNEVKTEDVNINVTAYGSMTSIDLMREIINDIVTNEGKYDELGTGVSNLQDVLNTIINVADGNPNLVSNTLNFVNGLAQITACFGVNLYDEVLENIDSKLVGTVTVEEADRVLSLFNVIDGELVIMDDLFIDTNSQLGQGFDDGVSYNGFTRFVKIFDAANFSDSRAVPSMPGITHSLETMNNTIIDDIVSELDFGVAADNVVKLNDNFTETYFIDGNVSFEFESEYSGERTFSANGCEIEVLFYNDNNCLESYHSANSVLNTEFEVGIKYLIVVNKEIIGNQTISFTPTNSLILGNNSDIQIGSSKRVIYNLNVIDPGYYFIRIENTSVELENGVFCESKLYYVYLSPGNNSIYLKNASSISIETSIEISVPQNVLGGIEFNILADNRVVKFTNVYDNTMNFEVNMHWNNVANNVYVYSQNSNYLTNSAIGVVGNNEATYSFVLSSGESCYLVFSVTDSNTTASVNISTDQLIWKINDSPMDSLEVTLPRGYTYTVSLWRYVDGSYVEVICDFLYPVAAGQTYTHTSDGKQFTIFSTANISNQFAITSLLANGFSLSINVGEDVTFSWSLINSINISLDCISNKNINQINITFTNGNQTITESFNSLFISITDYVVTAATNQLTTVHLNYFVFDDIRIYNNHIQGEVEDFVVHKWFGGGSGVSNDPYIISCYRHLDNIRKNVYAHYKQTNNIDMQNGNAWVPIPSFYGLYDGFHYTISNLYVEIIANGSYNGLFGTVQGTVKNVYLTYFGVYGGEYSGMTSSASATFCYVGGITGLLYSGGKIINCNVNFSSYAECQIYQMYVGGIAGKNNGTISDCDIYDMDMNVSGFSGAIVGYNSGSVSNCTVENIDIVYYYNSSNGKIGGIVGYNSGSISNCSGISGTIYWTCTDSNTSIQPMIGEIIGSNASSGTFSSITSNISSNINCAIITQKYRCFACEDGKIGYRE